MVVHTAYIHAMMGEVEASGVPGGCAHVCDGGQPVLVVTRPPPHLGSVLQRLLADPLPVLRSVLQRLLEQSREAVESMSSDLNSHERTVRMLEGQVGGLGGTVQYTVQYTTVL